MKNFEKLLLGAANIEKMRRDIKDLTSTMLGMADPTEFREVRNPSFGEYEVGSAKVGARFEWVIIRHSQIRAGEKTLKLAVELVEKNNDSSRIVFSTHPLTQREPALADVRTVWFALEGLTEVLMHENPSFRSRCDHFFSAATDPV